MLWTLLGWCGMARPAPGSGTSAGALILVLPQTRVGPLRIFSGFWAFTYMYVNLGSTSWGCLGLSPTHQPCRSPFPPGQCGRAHPSSTPASLPLHLGFLTCTVGNPASQGHSEGDIHLYFYSFSLELVVELPVLSS